MLGGVVLANLFVELMEVLDEFQPDLSIGVL